jgi:hypothetical protein
LQQGQSRNGAACWFDNRDDYVGGDLQEGDATGDG